MLPNGFSIRPIEAADNKAIASVIRSTLEEFGAAHPGTVYFDTTTDHLWELFDRPAAFYQVALYEGRVVGGGGIFPTEGLPEGTAELVKMYLLPEARGKGVGSRLIRNCIEGAAALGYRQLYLETMPELRKALDTYQHLGFRYLNAPMGNSGHFGCSLWMARML